MKNLRNHLPFIVIVPLLIIVMTWPTLRYVFDSDAFWLPTERDDVYMLFWDAWYSGLMLTEGADFYFTDLKFHPHGVSLAYHNFSLPHMFLFGGLSAVMPRSSAFNLAYLLLVFASTLSGYVYFRYLLRDRWLSLFGAVVFGTSAFVLARPATPHISFIATLPLSLYFLHRGLAEDRRRFLIAAGLLIGFTAFIGLYTLVCLLISVALFMLCFAWTRWRQPAFWTNIVIVALIVSAIGSVRIVPMLENPASLSSALTKNIDNERGRDLLGYLVNYENPFTGPLLKSLFGSENIENGWRQTVYLGYLPMLLIAIGLVSARPRPEIWLWLSLLLIFLLLRLGSTLLVNDVAYESIRLPKYFLAQLLPQVFQPFWNTDPFFAGAIFPFVLLTCFGLKALLKRLPSNRQVSVILIAAGLIAFEYYQPPDPLVIPDAQLTFISEFRQEENQAANHLIHLPMGGNLSKIYDFYQTFNGYPHAEGRPTRTPLSAFDYIEDNLLLSSWRRHESIMCLPWVQNQYLSGLNQLLSDGFTHVLYHHHLDWRRSIRQSFAGVQPAYVDNYVTIYHLEELHVSCRPETVQVSELFSHLQYLVQSPALTPDEGMIILSFHPSDRMADESFRLLESVFSDWKRFAHSHLLDGELQLQSSNPTHSDTKDFLSAEGLILLLYNPTQTGKDRLGPLGEAIANDFQACPPIIDAENLVAAYYPRTGFDCALLMSADRFEVAFDNGLRLANLLYTADGDSLDIQSWWTRLPADAHGVSIQIFDERGEKATGGDFVIHHESLASHRLDLSSLAPGEYSVKLILYNFESGRSVPGMVLSSQARFERALDIGSIAIE